MRRFIRPFQPKPKRPTRPPAAPAAEAEAPEPLSADELEVLVARIALYPDELVAAISQASLYPLQIVEADRFLDRLEKDKSLKPKEEWDGSVISLLNYPEVVKMMSEDLDWTQSLGDALTYQQKDVLIAIQQLRDEAVAKEIIKSDEKVQVVQSGDNVVIQPTVAETIYVPQYEPQMLYAPDYPPAPISYYPEPYPSYYYPTAGFFAGAVTGVLWGAAMDWDNWDVWGGGWNGGDLDIDCNNCFNNINGKVNWKDVDWKNVDRSKINFDRNQLAQLRSHENQGRHQGERRQLHSKPSGEVKRERTGNRADRTPNRDIRKSALGDQSGRPGRRRRECEKAERRSRRGATSRSRVASIAVQASRRPARRSTGGRASRQGWATSIAARSRRSTRTAAARAWVAVHAAAASESVTRSGGNRAAVRGGGNRGVLGTKRRSPRGGGGGGGGRGGGGRGGRR